ncbi:MAG: Crp/Fnr family transcriptional regulator [Lysobacteraceae bacterium]|nr:MAG: Crp/Fnr family transcriptional regulator [Xanthomonadaceae bacterium]
MINAPPVGNRLLRALPDADLARLRPLLHRVPLVAGEVLCETDRPQHYALFPISGLIALNYVTQSGATSAVALVGKEGFVGISLFLSGARTLVRAEVVSAGEAWRLNADDLHAQLWPGSVLQTGALHYIQALTTQMAQTAVCNRHHSVPQQLSRWLLLALDRCNDQDLRLTQEQMAQLLGVRREGVTEAAGKLQAQGLISYTRGLVHLVDRAGLEAHTCECYAEVRRAYDRLLPMPLEALHD